MTSLRPWLTPTLLSPLLVTWAIATYGAFVIGAATFTHGLIDNWAVLMLWATFFGSTMGVALVGADVAFLSFKMRRLPTGGQAWVSSLVTPFLCYGAWAFLPPPGSEVGLAVFILGPIAAAAALSRLFFGSRP